MFIQSDLLKKLDYPLLASVLLLVALGLVLIYSATKPADISLLTGEAGQYTYTYDEVKKQLVWIFLGVAAIITMVMYLYHEDLMKHTDLLYAINLVMLAAVIFLGTEELGAQRRVSIGGFLFQPSEFAKLFIIICFAAFLVKRKNNLNTIMDLLPCFAYVAVPVLLILIQPDLGTALVFFAVMFGMLYAAGANYKLLLTIGTTALSSICIWIWAHFWMAANRGIDLWIPLTDYQLKRLTIFLDPWQDPLHHGYNIIQSQIAIGQGGLLGKGLFQGSQTHGDFLPIQESDFIFAVIGEELGFIGAVILLALYAVVIYRGVLITINAKDDYGALLAVGVVSMIAFHVFVNVGMTCGIMPVTGIPLPMVSYGGSSMLTNLIAIGLLLSINIRRRRMF